MSPKQHLKIKREICLHFEETAQYAVPVQTSLSIEELQELYNDTDKWFELVESVEDWHQKHLTAVVNRELETIYTENGTEI